MPDAPPPPLPAHIAPAKASTDIAAQEPQLAADPAAVESPFGERPALRVVGGTAVRSERYYQPARQKLPQRVSPEALDVLRRVQAVGEVAHLIVTFGPHAGETLGQVAQSDPDYLRQLAVNAQRRPCGQQRPRSLLRSAKLSRMYEDLELVGDVPPVRLR